jgi:hypothetical protein
MERSALIAFSARQNAENDKSIHVRYKYKTNVSLELEFTNKDVYIFHYVLCTCKWKRNLKLQKNGPDY